MATWPDWVQSLRRGDGRQQRWEGAPQRPRPRVLSSHSVLTATWQVFILLPLYRRGNGVCGQWWHQDARLLGHGLLSRCQGKAAVLGPLSSGMPRVPEATSAGLGGEVTCEDAREHGPDPVPGLCWGFTFIT